MREKELVTFLMKDSGANLTEPINFLWLACCKVSQLLFHHLNAFDGKDHI